MNDTIAETAVKRRPRAAPAAPKAKPAVTLSEHIVEIISDSGEGAQRCGQTFGAIASQMGNGVWTVEIIPAEIRPPARSVAGGSGNIKNYLRIRDSDIGDADETGIGTFFGIDLRERNFARIRAA